MASSDAKAIPVKNAALRITFPILDADGDLVTGATSLDSEVSKDGGTFADCTNEATEIATSSGMYYLDLTSTEMNADTVAVIVKSGNGKTTPIVLYTASQNINDIPTAATIADAVWDEAQSGHTTGGSFGEIATEIADILVDTGTTLDGKINTIDGIVDDILVDTATLGAPAGASHAADIAAIKSDTAAILTDTGTTLDGKIDSILTDTAEIGAAGAGLTAVPWNAAWDAEVQSEVADGLAAYDPPTKAELDSAVAPLALEATAQDILTDTGTTLPSTLSTIDTVVDAIKLVTDKLSGLALTNGTIGSTGNSTTTLHLDGLTYGDDEINGHFLAILDVSTGEIHVREITDWVLSTELATVATLPFTPENAVDTYWILSNTAVAAGSAPTASEIADAVWDEATAGHVSAGTFGKLGADVLEDTGTTLQAELDGIQADTEDIQSKIGSPAVSVAADIADVESKVDDLEGRLTATRAGYLDNLSAGAVALESTAQAILTDTGTTLDGKLDAVKVTTDKLDDTLEDDAGTYRFTTNALEQAPTGGSAPTAAQIADAVWDEAQADHVAAGSFGIVASEIADILVDTSTTLQAELDGIQADTEDLQAKVGTPAGASVSADIAAVKAETATILADTNELQGDWVNGGRLDLILDARASQTSVDDLPTNAELATALGTADDATLAAIAAVDTKIDTLDNVADGIKAKTDSLTFTVAGQVDANVQRINDVTITGDGQTGTEFGV